MSLDQKLLAIALNDKKCATELLNATSHSYYNANLQWLFATLKHYFQDPNIKAIPTENMVREYIGGNDNEQVIDKHLSVYNGIKNSKYKVEEFGWLLEKIKVRYNDKVQKDAQDKIGQLLRGPASKSRVDEVNKVIKETAVNIDSIHKQNVYKEGALRDSVDDRIKKYEHIEANPESAQGILTGMSTFDKITNGLHPGEFMIIGGETGTGKSVLLHNIAVNAYLGKNKVDSIEFDDSGRNVLIFSLEMPKESMERRIDACLANIFSNHIRDGLLNDEDKEKYIQSLAFQKRYNKDIYIVDMPKGATTRDIEIKYTEVCDTMFRPDLVAVDYLGIMSSNESTGQDWMDLGVISEELHEFSRVYEVSTVSASQLNRPKEGKEGQNNNNRIARSGMVPNNCNIIIQIANRPDEDLRSDMLVVITKMRDGQKGQFILSKDFARMRVIDLVDETFGEDDEDLI